MKANTIIAIAMLTIAACERSSMTEATPAPAAVEVPLPPPAVPVIPPVPGSALDNVRVIDIAHAAREIEAAPEQIDDVLTRHGLDRASFETAIAEIAKDGWKSDLYIAALARPASS